MENNNDHTPYNVPSGDTLSHGSFGCNEPNNDNKQFNNDHPYDHQHYDHGSTDDTAPFDVAAFLDYLDKRDHYNAAASHFDIWDDSDNTTHSTTYHDSAADLNNCGSDHYNNPSANDHYNIGNRGNGLDTWEF